jgi:nickel-type superoxide dismutase maturation protease
MRTPGGRARPLGLALGIGLLAGAAVIARRQLDAVVVVGESMLPELRPGDRLVVESWTFARRTPRAGEVVLAADPRRPQRELIKRIASVDASGGWVQVAGDAADASTDSRVFGALPTAGLRWRAVLRYWPADRIGLIRRQQPQRQKL